MHFKQLDQMEYVRTHRLKCKRPLVNHIYYYLHPKYLVVRLCMYFVVSFTILTAEIYFDFASAGCE